MPDNIRTTIQTLDEAAAGRLFEINTVMAQVIDEDAVSMPLGDVVAIISVLAGVLLCVGIGV